MLGTKKRYCNTSSSAFFFFFSENTIFENHLSCSRKAILPRTIDCDSYVCVCAEDCKFLIH